MFYDYYKQGFGAGSALDYGIQPKDSDKSPILILPINSLGITKASQYTFSYLIGISALQFFDSCCFKMFGCSTDSLKNITDVYTDSSYNAYTDYIKFFAGNSTGSFSLFEIIVNPLNDAARSTLNYKWNISTSQVFNNKYF